MIGLINSKFQLTETDSEVVKAINYLFMSLPYFTALVKLFLVKLFLYRIAAELNPPEVKEQV